jgi:NAD(P)-dependent dehydrogenase (short-subunit alcohol dehydrogenase family)
MKYKMESKKVIITGANSGIGKAAAIKLANLGATVIMACRSEDQGRKAVEEVKQVTGNNNVEFMQVDLSLQKSIRQFANEYLLTHDRLDVIIHNAANFDHSLKKATKTSEGFETVFATNHLGVFLLTNLILETLIKSRPSRIITIASKGLMMYPFLDIDFNNLNGERRFSMQHAYYQSKLAQVMFTYELARRLEGTGVTVNCVRVANVAIPDERLTHLSPWQRKIYSLKRKMAITPEKQAETYVYLAADPSVEGISGKYWDENNKPVRSNNNSYNASTQKKLWEISASMTGLT